MVKRKDRILISAIDLLEEGGVNNLTIKRLAELQGITEPALYRQYKNKKEILIAVVEEYTNYDQRIINTIRDQKMKGNEAIEFFVMRFTELYHNYPELATIYFSLDLYYYDPVTREMMVSVFQNRIEFLEAWLTQHSLEGCPLSPRVISRLINDALDGELKRWKLAGMTYDLVNTVMDNVKEILRFEEKQ